METAVDGARMVAPLIIDEGVEQALRELRNFAADAPIDIRSVQERLQTQQGELLHREDMNARTVMIPGPFPFFVTYSLETKHPCGTVRHMSMSVQRTGAVPSPQGLWEIASRLGFLNGLASCQCWAEELSSGGTAINVAQPLATMPEAVA